jgi:hypothetical protein
VVSGVQAGPQGRRRRRCAAAWTLEGRPRYASGPASGPPRDGGGRGGWGRCAGAGSWRAPLPVSYARVGIAGRYFAGRGPGLTASVGWLKESTGIGPAAACVPAHRPAEGGVMITGSAGHLGPGEPGELAGDRGHRHRGDLPAPGQLGVGGVQPLLGLPRAGQRLGRLPGLPALERGADRGPVPVGPGRLDQRAADQLRAGLGDGAPAGTRAAGVSCPS